MIKANFWKLKLHKELLAMENLIGFSNDLIFFDSENCIWQNYEYLIKWQGCPLQDCTWEPSDNLTEELIR